MGNKLSKLEKDYIRLSGMSEEQLTAEKDDIIKKMAEVNAKINGLTERIANTTEESEKLENLSKSLENAKSEVKEMNKKLTRIEGLSKNKMSISRIITYKDQLTAKLNNLKNQKENNNKEIKAKEDEIKSIENGNVTKEIELKLQIIALKDNRDYTSEDAKEEATLKAQLEAIKARKVTLAKEKATLEKDNEAIDKKIEQTEVAISKCNLAWKSLFQNETWDQIHAKSLEGRFTRNKQKEKELKEEAQKEEQSVEKTDLDNTIKIDVEEIKKAEAEKAELPAKKSKLRTFFSSIIHPIKSIKNWRANKKAAKLEEEKEDNIENKEENIENKEDNTENKVNEENEKSFEIQRDAFITQLQKMAEKPKDNVGANLDQIDRMVRDDQRSKNDDDRELD